MLSLFISGRYPRGNSSCPGKWAPNVIYSDILDLLFFSYWTLAHAHSSYPRPALDWLGITVPAASARPKTQSDDGIVSGRDDHFRGKDAAGVVVLPEIASAAALLDRMHGGEVAAFQQQQQELFRPKCKNILQLCRSAEKRWGPLTLARRRWRSRTRGRRGRGSRTGGAPSGCCVTTGRKWGRFKRWLDLEQKKTAKSCETNKTN